MDDPSIDMKSGPDLAALLEGVPFPAQFFESYAGHVRHNLVGEIDTALLAGRGRLQAVFVGNDENPLIGFNPDASLDLTGFHKLSVRLFIRIRNAGMPRYMYPR